ncbi:site-specific integrase [Methylobacterium oxalidis]|uniref:site-specific integrase n=1 Tax=Methylobacterium oxalidis TaxID=944322 RepID=UPI0033158597
MCLASNIARRAGSASYYARLGVPKDLQPILGRRELWKSLGTKDAREAKARVATVLAQWHDEFAELRRRRDARPATADDIQAEVWAHYRDELEQHDIVRRHLPTAAEIGKARSAAVTTFRAERISDPIAQIAVGAEALLMADQSELNRDIRIRRKAELEKHLAVNETVLVRDVALDLIDRNNYAIEPDTRAFRDLCHRLMRAEIEALRRVEEHDRGDYTGRPQDPIIKPPLKVVAPPVAAPGESILDLYETFANENPRNVKADTICMNREIVGWFAQHVGPTFPASAINKKAVREWKQALAQFPIKAAEVREFRGLKFKKIIAENERLKRPTLSDRTINKYLSALGAFCHWLMQNGHIETNPVEGMHLGKEKAKGKIKPYTSEQLSAIFSSPLFTGCQSEDAPHKPGTVQIRDHRYWLPLLSLFTGARMGELAQLLTADVREDRGRWILHITREGDDAKTTKTKGSQRVIPVHAELVRLGFLKFHEERVQAGEKRLFPEIKPDARGQLAGHYSRFYGRYVARIGVKLDASVNFHSFRHGMADALRRAGYRDEEFGFLLGHAQATTTGRYGILSEGDLARSCEMIDAVSFPGLSIR